MQYMILVCEPEEAYGAPDGQAKLKDIVARHMALAAELKAQGVQKDGGGLQGTETATTVATNNGQQTLHDGPFAETREHLGGYYLIDVPNLDDAIAIARRVPVIDGGKVEVRPLIVH